MTETPTSNTAKKSPPRVMRLKTCEWWDCEKKFETDLPNKKTCSDEHRDLLAAQRAEERKAKTGQKSGGGRRAQTEKEWKIAEALKAMEDNGVEISDAVKRLPPELQYTSQRGLPHAAPLRPGDPRIMRFKEVARKAPRFSWKKAADLVDDRPNTARYFEKYYEKCVKGLVDDIDFVETVDDAMARTFETYDDAAYEEAVIGVERFGVSMGERVSLGKVRDTKLLAQLLKVTNKEFARANAAGGSSVTVNVQNGAATPNPDDPNNPTFHFTYYETLALGDDDRAALSRIATRIISARKKEPVMIDLEPDAKTKQLMLEAREIAEDVEDLNDI